MGIEDVSRVIVELLSADVTAERFIVSAENKSYESIFNAISDAFGKKRPWRRATPFLAALAWRLEFSQVNDPGFAQDDHQGNVDPCPF